MKKYKCSRCETIGEAVSETLLACPVCGEEMLRLKEGQELETEQVQNNELTVAKVVSLGFYDLLPIPAGSKLDMFRQKLETVNFSEPIQTKDGLSVFKQLSETVYNPINNNILGNYKKQKLRQIRFCYLLVTVFIIIFFSLFWLLTYFNLIPKT